MALLLPFLLGLTATLFSSIFFPSLHLIGFAPFLAIACMRKSFLTALWLALLTGLIMDLTTSEMGFGMHALAYVVTTVVLYKQKRHFFHDQSLALSLFTLLISLLISLILILLQGIPLSISLAASDLVIMPLVDAIYAFFWFTCPIRLYHYGRKVGWRRLFKMGAD